MLVALACAVLAGSTSVVSASGTAVAAPKHAVEAVLGKRWI
jgi:hypothetical protein